MITRTLTAEQATAPTAAARENSRGCTADNAIAAALDYFAAATAPHRVWRRTPSRPPSWSGDRSDRRPRV